MEQHQQSRPRGRQWIRQWLQAFANRWNADMAKTRAASEAADMEIRRELNEALIKIRENERQHATTRRQLARLSETVAEHGAKLGKHSQELLEHSQELLELDQRQGIVDALLEGGSSFW